MKILSTVVAAIAALCLGAAPADGVTREIRAFLINDMRNLERENLEAALQSFLPEMRDSAKAQLQPLFDRYDLRYNLVNMRVVSYSGNRAVVRVTQETRKVSGPQFQNNRLIAEHTLIKIGRKWFYADTKVIDIQMLD